jgi:hypothetical protein
MVRTTRVKILPAFALLHVLDQKSLLPEESVAEPGPAGSPRGSG